MNVITKPDFSFSLHVRKRHGASNRSVSPPLTKHSLCLSLVQTAMCAPGAEHVCAESIDPLSDLLTCTPAHLCPLRNGTLGVTCVLGVDTD